MKCLYYIQGNEFSYDLLLSYLALNKVTKLSDLDNLNNEIKFSFSSEVAKKIDEAIIKDNYEITISDDGETIIKGILSVLEYIDSHNFAYLNDSGRKFPIGMNKEDFKKWVLKNYIDTQGMSKEYAKAKVDYLIRHWEEIKNDAITIHKFMTQVVRKLSTYDAASGKYIKMSSSLFTQLLEKKFPDFMKKLTPGNKVYLINKLQELLEFMNRKIYSAMSGLKSNDKGMEKFHLKFKGITQELENVGIHVDRLFIDKFGHVHVYNYKVTSGNPKDWSINKRKKYEYEMAFLKKILEQNGISTIGAEFYHVPIILDYDEFTGDLKDVHIGEFIAYQGKTLFNNINEEIDKFISSTSVFASVDEKMVHETLSFLGLINGDYNPDLRGLEISAKSWIERNMSKIDRNTETGGWTVRISSTETIEIESPDPISINEELKQKVAEYFGENDNDNSIPTTIANAIINNYATGTFFENGRKLNFDLMYLKKVFGMYHNYKLVNGEKIYEWEINDDQPLIDCGILMFHNISTNLIDIVVCSKLNPRELIPLDYLHHNKILGYHVNDAKCDSQLDNTYGNMEIMRAISLLNGLSGLLDPKFKLGKIQVVSNFAHGSAIVMDCETAVKEYNKVGNQLHELFPSYKHSNNFKSSLFIKATDLIYDLFNDLIDPTTGGLSRRAEIGSLYNLGNFKGITEQAVIVSRMREIMLAIENKLNMKNPEDIYSLSYDRSVTDRTLAQIYIVCAEYINRFNGLEFPEIKYLNLFKRYVLPLYANPDSNVRLVTGLYNRALNTVAQNFQNEYGEMRKAVLEFYKAKGLNTNINTNSNIFEKMYSKDHPWYFVNPFDPNDTEANMLDNDERKFLKKALFFLAKMRNRSTLDSFKFTSENSPGFDNYIKGNKRNLMIPLEKSNYPGSYNIGKRTKKAAKELKEFIQDPKNYAVNKLDEKKRFSREQREEDYYSLTCENLFLNREQENERDELIFKFGDDYFEKNLEYLLADYAESLIAAEELLKVAFQTKCILMEMELLKLKIGSSETAGKWLSDSMKEIQDFIKSNIFGKSLMDPSEEEFIEMINPAKKLLSRMFIAWNVKGAVRDTFEGIWLNFALTVSKYYENLDAKSIFDGYKTVLSDMFHDSKTLDIVSELCLKYRLSNTDVAKIAERAKIDQGGIFNFDKLGYSTLRQPDFLNRMTLFVARCKMDGVFEAFSIEDDQLKYDCTKDKRFEKFIQGAKTDPEYLKQKALYYFYVNEYNKEHPNNQIGYDPKKTPLPEPYTNSEVETMKNVANTKYGAYDKSQRTKMSLTAWGQTLLMFSDWFSGHTASYIREKGYYDDIFSLKDKDGNLNVKKAASGNEMWMDNDGNIVERIDENKFINPDTGEEITEGEFVPIILKIPIYAQGIFYTLKDMWSVLKKDGLSLEAFLKEIFDNEWDVLNLRRLGTDGLFLVILGILFGKLLPDAYKEFKKTRDPENILANTLVDIMYGGITNSYEGFKGPLAIADYVKSDISPSQMTNVHKTFTDVLKMCIGQKSFLLVASADIPVIRLGKTALQQAYPDSFKN